MEVVHERRRVVGDDRRVPAAPLGSPRPAREEKKAASGNLLRWKACLCIKVDTDEQGEKQKSSPALTWRWMMLAILSIDICVSYIPYYTFVPIPRQSMQVFNVDEAALSLLCILYALVYVPAVFVTGPIVGKLGCRWTFVFAMALTALGCALRAWSALRSDAGLFWSALLEPHSLSTLTTTAPGIGVLPRANSAMSDYWWLVIGQALCALGQPFLVNPTSEMAAEWFPPHERPKAAIIANLMNFIGSSLSFVLPPLVVKEEHMSLQETEQEMSSLMRLQFWIAMLSLLLTLCLYRPAPRTRFVDHHMSCMAEAQTILRTRDFWLVNGFFTIYLAVCQTFDAVEGSILEHYGYSASLTSWTGISCAVAAIVSTIFEAHYIQSAEAYRVALLVAAGFMAVSQFLCYACLQFRMNGGVFVVAVGIMGLATPGWGCSCELGSEVCYPARESTVSAMLEASGNLGGVIGIIVIQHLIDRGFGVTVLALLGAMMVFAALGLVCLSGRLRRMEAEAEEELKVEEELHTITEDHLSVLERGASKDPGQTEVGIVFKVARRRSILVWIAVGAFLVCCRLLLALLQSQLPEDIAANSPLLWQASGDKAPNASAAMPHEPPETPASAESPRKPSNQTRNLLHRKAAMQEMPSYVISCKWRDKQLARFRKSMARQGLNFTVVPCVRADSQEVTRAIKEGLIGKFAKDAIGGVAKKGFVRLELLASAISHLRLLKQIANASSQMANVFEDEEVLVTNFVSKRNELLSQLRHAHGASIDIVKLDAWQAAGSQFRFGKKASWLNGNVFKMVSSLSPVVNRGLSNYVVTKQGAGKILRIAGQFDTFGRWEEFDQYLLSKIIKDIRRSRKNKFMGFAVQSSVLSFNCQRGRLTKSQELQCKGDAVRH